MHTHTSLCCALFAFYGARARVVACRRVFVIGSDGVDFNQPILGSLVPFRVLRRVVGRLINQLIFSEIS